MQLFQSSLLFYLCCLVSNTYQNNKSYANQSQMRYHMEIDNFIKEREAWRINHRYTFSDERSKYLIRKLFRDNPELRYLETQISRSSCCYIAIVIRSHKPNPTRFQNLLAWINSFVRSEAANRHGLKYVFHISMDVTRTRSFVESARQYFGSAPITIHTYNDEDITHAYPALLNLTEKYPPFFHLNNFTVSRGFHVEAILLWWQTVVKTTSDADAQDHRCTQVYDYVWVIEDDVAVSGGTLQDFTLHYDWLLPKLAIFKRAPQEYLEESQTTVGSRQLMQYFYSHPDALSHRQYNGEVHDERVNTSVDERFPTWNRRKHISVTKPSVSISHSHHSQSERPLETPVVDLLTYGRQRTLKYPNATYYDRWVFSDLVSDKYAAMISENRQTFTQEHVQRFSRRYLCALDILSRNGIVAWSEQSSVTLLQTMLRTYHVATIYQKHIGPVYHVTKKAKRANILKYESVHEHELKLWHSVQD